MKQIRLIKEDFNTLDVKTLKFRKQYQNSEDCPLFRATKRMGLNPYKVYSGSIRLMGGNKIDSNTFSFKYIRKAAQSLAKGSNYAIIEI